MQLNEITFAGFVGDDAKSQTVGQQNMTKTSFPLCHSYKKKDDSEVKTWVYVTGWGNVAEWMLSIKKGDNVIVKGQLSVQTYTDKNNVEKTSVSINAREFGILQKPQKSNNSAPNNPPW